MKGAEHIFTKKKDEVILNDKFWQYVKYGSTLIVVHLIIFMPLQKIHPW
jgi:hypothetical protein